MHDQMQAIRGHSGEEEKNAINVTIDAFCRASDLRTNLKTHSGQCEHCTVFFPLDRAQWDVSSNLTTVILLNIYLSQHAQLRGTLRKLDFSEPQTLNL